MFTTNNNNIYTSTHQNQDIHEGQKFNMLRKQYELEALKKVKNLLSEQYQSLSISSESILYLEHHTERLECDMEAEYRRLGNTLFYPESFYDSTMPPNIYQILEFFTGLAKMLPIENLAHNPKIRIMDFMLKELQKKSLPFSLGNISSIEDRYYFKTFGNIIVDSLKNTFPSRQDEQMLSLLIQNIELFFNCILKNDIQGIEDAMQRMKNMCAKEDKIAERLVVLNHFLDFKRKEMISLGSLPEYVAQNQDSILLESCFSQIIILQAAQVIDYDLFREFFKFAIYASQIENSEIKCSAIREFIKTDVFHYLKNHINNIIFDIASSEERETITDDNESRESENYIGKLKCEMDTILKSLSALTEFADLYDKNINRHFPESETSTQLFQKYNAKDLLLNDIRNNINHNFDSIIAPIDVLVKKNFSNPSLLKQISARHNVKRLFGRYIIQSTGYIVPGSIQYPDNSLADVEEVASFSRRATHQNIFLQEIYAKHRGAIEFFSHNSFSPLWGMPNLTLSVEDRAEEEQKRSISFRRLVAEIKGISKENISGLKNLADELAKYSRQYNFIVGNISAMKETLEQNKVAIKTLAEKDENKITFYRRVIDNYDSILDKKPSNDNIEKIEELERINKKIQFQISQREIDAEKYSDNLGMHSLCDKIYKFLGSIDTIQKQSRADREWKYNAVSGLLVEIMREGNLMRKALARIYKAANAINNGSTTTNSSTFQDWEEIVPKSFSSKFNMGTETKQVVNTQSASPSSGGGGNSPVPSSTTPQVTNPNKLSAITYSLRKDICDVLDTIKSVDLTSGCASNTTTPDLLTHLVSLINAILDHKSKVHFAHNSPKLNERPPQIPFEKSTLTTLHQHAFQTRQQNLINSVNLLYTLITYFTPLFVLNTDTKGNNTSVNVNTGGTIYGIPGGTSCTPSGGAGVTQTVFSSIASQQQMGKLYVFIQTNYKKYFTNISHQLWQNIKYSAKLDENSLLSQEESISIAPHIYNALCIEFFNNPSTTKIMRPFKKHGTRKKGNAHYQVSLSHLREVAELITDNKLRNVIANEISPALRGSNIRDEGFALPTETFKLLVDAEVSLQSARLSESAASLAEGQQWKNFVDGLAVTLMVPDFLPSDVTSERAQALRRVFDTIMHYFLPVLTNEVNSRIIEREETAENIFSRTAIKNILTESIKGRECIVRENNSIQKMLDIYKNKLTNYRVINELVYLAATNEYVIHYRACHPLLASEDIFIALKGKPKNLSFEEIEKLDTITLPEWKHKWEREIGYEWYTENSEWALLYAVLMYGGKFEREYYLNPEKIAVLAAISSGIIPEFIYSEESQLPCMLSLENVENWKKYMEENGGKVMPDKEFCMKLLAQRIRGQNLLSFHIKEGWSPIYPVVEGEICKQEKIGQDDMVDNKIISQRQNIEKMHQQNQHASLLERFSRRASDSAHAVVSFLQVNKCVSANDSARNEAIKSLSCERTDNML